MPERPAIEPVIETPIRSAAKRNPMRFIPEASPDAVTPASRRRWRYPAGSPVRCSISLNAPERSIARLRSFLLIRNSQRFRHPDVSVRASVVEQIPFLLSHHALDEHNIRDLAQFLPGFLGRKNAISRA
jgi:hypothetical protein